jgi:hypothetical protein
MIRASSMTWLLAVAGIAIYVSILIAQSRAAGDLCERYPAGSFIEDLENVDGSFLLSRMGPIRDRDNPDTTKLIFCAPLTMCDTSCSLEIQDRVVKRAVFSNH